MAGGHPYAAATGVRRGGARSRSRRHQLRGFVARVAEHQALVAGTLVQVQARAFIDALGDVRGLLVVGNQHGATLVVDAVFRVVVADALDGFAGDLNIIHVCVRGDLAGQHDEARVAQRFGGDAGARVLGQDRVEDGVGNLVRDLVGMAFGDGFGSEEVIDGRHASSCIGYRTVATTHTACDALAIFLSRFASCLLTQRLLLTWYFTLLQKFLGGATRSVVATHH